MPVTIFIRGDAEGEDAESGKAFEEAVAEKAREFAQGLEGVASATISAEHLTATDLLETE